MKKSIVAASLTLFSAALALAAAALFSCAGAQTLGTYSTAAIASDGEGGVFMSGGKDQFRTGLFSRFRMSARADIGFQGGFDRLKGTNAWGAGADVKIYVVGEGSTLPLDLALDMSLGHLRSEHTGMTILGIGVLASGRLQADTRFPVDPYASLGLYNTFFHRENECGSTVPPDFCGDNSNSDTEVVVRAGAKLYLDSERQILAEIKLDGSFSIGAAFNIVF